MNRRGILATLLAAVGAPLTIAATRARADTAPDRPKVAYHLCDLDKVAFVLGNIRNHFDGMGGPDKVTIALVVHGPALKAFHAASAAPDTRQGLRKFTEVGLKLHACTNTMKAQRVTPQELLPGFVGADRGGVVLLAELQSQGYAYIRP